MKPRLAPARNVPTTSFVVLFLSLLLWLGPTTGCHLGGEPIPHPPIIQAIHDGDEARALQLLAAGSEVNKRDADGNTPLAAAAHAEMGQLVAKLIAAGADVNSQSLHGGTALMEAANVGSAEIVRKLLQAGAQKGTKDRTGLTAADYARARSLATSGPEHQRYEAVLAILATE